MQNIDLKTDLLDIAYQWKFKFVKVISEYFGMNMNWN